MSWNGFLTRTVHAQSSIYLFSFKYRSKDDTRPLFQCDRIFRKFKNLGTNLDISFFLLSTQLMWECDDLNKNNLRIEPKIGIFKEQALN